jgi:hypothetical protein
MADHQHHREVLDELSPQHRALRQMIPEVYQGFAALSGAALGSHVQPGLRRWML